MAKIVGGSESLQHKFKKKMELSSSLTNLDWTEFVAAVFAFIWLIVIDIGWGLKPLANLTILFSESTESNWINLLYEIKYLKRNQ